MLDEGFVYLTVLEATKLLVNKGSNPSALPSFVNQVQNGETPKRGNGHKPFDASDQDYEGVVAAR
jgi:hypothetical protein